MNEDIRPGAIARALDEALDLANRYEMAAWRDPGALCEYVAAARAELAAKGKALETASNYIDALERYGALPHDARTKAEQGELLTAADAYRAARGESNGQ